MKLVADIDNIMSNLNVLSADIEEYQSAMANFNGASVNCSLDEVKSLIESYKNSISEDLNKLNTSSEDYKTLVDECCTEYQANEANVQVGSNNNDRSNYIVNEMEKKYNKNCHV